MNNERPSIETGENLTGINVQVGKNEYGDPTTSVEVGPASNQPVLAKFGKNGERYCSVVAKNVRVSSGDAIVTRENEHVVDVVEGVPTMEAPLLENENAFDIKRTWISTNGGSLESLEGRLSNETAAQDRKEYIAYMKTMGITMSRAELGVLSHTTDYVFTVGEGSEVFVGTGVVEGESPKYLEARGPATLQVTKGLVQIKTEVEGTSYEVTMHISTPPKSKPAKS